MKYEEFKLKKEKAKYKGFNKSIQRLNECVSTSQITSAKGVVQTADNKFERSAPIYWIPWEECPSCLVEEPQIFFHLKNGFARKSAVTSRNPWLHLTVLEPF